MNFLRNKVDSETYAFVASIHGKTRRNLIPRQGEASFVRALS